MMVICPRRSGRHSLSLVLGFCVPVTGFYLFLNFNRKVHKGMRLFNLELFPTAYYALLPYALPLFPFLLPDFPFDGAR
jgi:hypothetical protein